MSVSPPRPKGPPLNALRAFEAAGRLGGFAPAAEELSVTPGAISQQIKSLEAWASAPLFNRHAQGVRLTRTGARLLPDLVRAFDTLGDVARKLRDAGPRTKLQIAALPSVAQLWLSPRLPALRKALPDNRISVTAMEHPPNLKREVFDLCLFLTEPTGAGSETILMRDEIFPVCAPDVAARLETPRDLAGETLLVDESWAGDWPQWAAAAGCDLPNITEAARYSLYALALAEARSGAGVLIGHTGLVQDALNDGSLVAPFGLRVPTGKSLVLTTTGSCKPLAQVLANL